MSLGLIYSNSVDEKLISPSEFYVKIKGFADGMNYTKPRPTNTEINYDKIYPAPVYRGLGYD